METRLGRLARWALTLGSFGALASITIATAVFTDRRVYGVWWVVCFGVLALALVAWRLCGVRALRRWRSLRTPKWILPVGLFAVFFSVKAVFASAWPAEQRSDFLDMYNAALAINAGDYSFADQAYWYFFAYQTPFAVYEAVVLRIFGGSLTALFILAALAMAGINLLVYLLARRMTGSAGGVGAGGMLPPSSCAWSLPTR
ncbi:MAG: hypothetical protein LBG11_11835 [Bifidobacteriaceae bacterium]|jgi:hypothetical protein|nr:hypothetical protein [Bifidobacteriaceae bacterium]